VVGQASGALLVELVPTSGCRSTADRSPAPPTFSVGCSNTWHLGPIRSTPPRGQRERRPALESGSSCRL